MADTQPLVPTDAEIVTFAVENGMRVRTGSGAVYGNVFRPARRTIKSALGIAKP